MVLCLLVKAVRFENIIYCLHLILVLNSQLLKERTAQPEMTKEQDDWLDEKLDEAKNGNYKHIVVFQHIPYFHDDENEPEDMVKFVFEGS